jgi:DNA-binding GntR family transcriptional regulator
MLNYSAETSLDVKKKRPAHQSVHDELRDQILFGELAPGQPVTIQGIAEALGAGMTPVREAIRRLTSAGALSMMGNRRVTVPELTESGIEELDFMRKKLEPELTIRASANITPEGLDALRSEDDALNQAIDRGDIGAYLTHNYRFHARIYSLAQAPIMAATVDRLWLRFGPSLRVVCGRYGTKNLPDKHADLLAALVEGDPQAAANAMLEDIDQGMSQIREALRESAGTHRFD